MPNDHDQLTDDLFGSKVALAEAALQSRQAELEAEVDDLIAEREALRDVVDAVVDAAKGDGDPMAVVNAFLANKRFLASPAREQVEALRNFLPMFVKKVDAHDRGVRARKGHAESHRASIYAQVEAEYRQWKKNPGKDWSKAKFAKRMQDRFPDLTNTEVILRHTRRWDAEEKARKSTPGHAP